MDTRASIEALLDKTYAARRDHDAAALAALFTSGGSFAANGTPAATDGAGRFTALKSMLEEFVVVEFTQHCRVIDPPRAVVHWRGKFRALNGRMGETDVLDIFEIQDGKICAVITFFDTAYAANLAG